MLWMRGTNRDGRLSERSECECLGPTVLGSARRSVRAQHDAHKKGPQEDRITYCASFYALIPSRQRSESSL